MSRCIHRGWLSTGVLPPESSWSTMIDQDDQQGELGHGPGDGPQEEPERGREEQVEHDARRGTAASDPAIGTSRSVRTTRNDRGGDGQRG